MDLFHLGGIKDPALLACGLVVALYLNRDYVKKSEHDKLADQVEKMQNEYVSKEKLTDVLKPFSDQISIIGREIGEIKKIVLEAWKK